MKQKQNETPLKTLSQDLTRRLIFTVSAIFIITSVINYWIYTLEAKARYVEKSSEYLAYLQDNLKVPLWNIDREWIESICWSISKNEMVALLQVTGENGEYLFDMVNEKEPNLIVQKSGITYRNQLIGQVELGLTKRLYMKSNYQILFRSILQMLFVIIGLMLVTRLILNRIVEKPLNHLISRIDEISAGDYRENRHAFDHFEVASILDRFNLMASRVKKREQSLIEANRNLESEIAEREGAEKALRESEKRYRQLVEDLPVGIFRSSPDVQGPFLMANPALRKMFGYGNSGEFDSQTVMNTYQDPDMRRHILDMIFREGSIQGVELGFRKKDGAALVGLVTAHGVTDNNGKPLYIDGIIEDITDRKNLERQIRQAQKMEAIGTLAGGIAHDFNNILSSIFGFAEVAKMRCAQGKDIEGSLNEILTAGLRARSLIKQIVTFSRQTDVRKHRITLDPIVKETVKFLRASLPATIEIQHRIHIPDTTVIADPTQIHQILMNLCLNAAHAMEKGGVLEVALDEATQERRPDRPTQEFTPAKYVRLTVSDNGHGIQKEFIDRIFEPFFTTKPRGEGTGMGLAMVHGIVRDLNGAVSVESEPGRGARFHVLIPMAEGRPEAFPEMRPSPRAGGARILFVDDEEGFTASGKEILAQFGYDVITAASGHEALKILDVDGVGFDLVITDMVMPKMTGIELAKRITQACPRIPIILCTGFSALVDGKAKRNSGIRHTLMKPLLAGELTEAIEHVLKAETD